MHICTHNVLGTEMEPTSHFR